MFVKDTTLFLSRSNSGSLINDALLFGTGQRDFFCSKQLPVAAGKTADECAKSEPKQ